jgi:hypothetical protein
MTVKAKQLLCWAASLFLAMLLYVAGVPDGMFAIVFVNALSMIFIAAIDR